MLRLLLYFLPKLDQLLFFLFKEFKLFCFIGQALYKRINMLLYPLFVNNSNNNNNNRMFALCFLESINNLCLHRTVIFSLLSFEENSSLTLYVKSYRHTAI